MDFSYRDQERMRRAGFSALQLVVWVGLFPLDWPGILDGIDESVPQWLQGKENGKPDVFVSPMPDLPML